MAGKANAVVALHKTIITIVILSFFRRCIITQSLMLFGVSLTLRIKLHYY